jgi:hypothetical protein
MASFILPLYLTYPAKSEIIGLKRRKHMTTMTKDILQAMHYPEHSGGQTEVDIQTIKKIIQKHDPEGFESFDPFEGLE